MIIDFIESRKPKEVIEKTTSKQNRLTFLWVFFGIGLAIGVVMFLLSIGEILWNYIPIWISKNHHFDTLFTIDWIISGIGIAVGLLLIVGVVFMVLNNYHPKKIFKILSWFGFPISWFYLLLKIIDQKETHYFFKDKNITNSSTQQVLEH